jgi:hypothetical protein
MKSEVYSWRVSADLKATLESEARRRNLSLAQLLEQVTRDWLDDRQNRNQDDTAEQARLQAAARQWIGGISGDNPRRSEMVRDLVRERLARKHGRRLSG